MKLVIYNFLTCIFLACMHMHACRGTPHALTPRPWQSDSFVNHTVSAINSAIHKATGLTVPHCSWV